MKFVSPAKICFMWKWPNVFYEYFFLFATFCLNWCCSVLVEKVEFSAKNVAYVNNNPVFCVYKMFKR